MAEHYLDEGFDRAAFLKKLYKRGVDAWSADREEWYTDNWAYAHDQNPIMDELPDDEPKPSLPLFSEAIDLINGTIDKLENQTERTYRLKSMRKILPDQEAANRDKIERLYTRLDFAMKQTNFRQKMRTWRINAGIFPVAWAKCLGSEVKEERPEMVNQDLIDQSKSYGFVPKTVYYGPDVEILQPEQVIFDVNARSTDLGEMTFWGHRVFHAADTWISRYPQTTDGEEVTEEMLRPAKAKDEQRRRMEEASGHEFTEEAEEVEGCELYFRLLDPETKTLRIRWVLFVPAAQGADNAPTALIFRDEWWWGKGALSKFYCGVPIYAHERPSRIEGRSHVDRGKMSKNEADDLIRLFLLSVAYDTFGEEIVEEGVSVSPEENLAGPGQRKIVSDINKIRTERKFNPNIPHLVDALRIFNDNFRAAVGANAANTQVSLRENSAPTATLTREQRASFDVGIGMIYDNYIEGERKVIEFYLHAIKQLNVEGKNAEFEYGLFGGNPPPPEWTVEDLLLDVEVEVVPYLKAAQGEVEKVLIIQLFDTLKGWLALPLWTLPQIMMVEELLRAFNRSENFVQQFLKPYREAQQVLEKAMGGAVGPVGAGATEANGTGPQNPRLEGMTA